MGDQVFKFNVTELLFLVGLIQSIYILVYIAFRTGALSRVVLPLVFFSILSLTFLFGVAESRWHSIIPHYDDIQWMLWVSLAPLSMLLAIKIINITANPRPIYWAIWGLVPLSYIGAKMLAQHYGQISQWYDIIAIFIGATSLLAISTKRTDLDTLHTRQNGKERFWLIISLVLMNAALMSLHLGLLNKLITNYEADLIRALVGISFVYIASTGLFRIFPQTAGVVLKTAKKDDFLSTSDIEIAQKIENLLHTDKVYQEPSYGRTDLANELSISESNLSRIVKLYFEKGVPQLLNELRVEEAKIFLKQTEADVTTISGESGFNSIATFNRVFKEIEGVSPSEYRAKK